MFLFLDTHEVCTMRQEVEILHSGLEIKSEVGVLRFEEGNKTGKIATPAVVHI